MVRQQKITIGEIMAYRKKSCAMNNGAKILKCAVAVAAAVFSLAALGARSVDWPTTFETQLAAHMAAITPSEDRRATSDAYTGFDSVCKVFSILLISELRNTPVKGFKITIR